MYKWNPMSEWSHLPNAALINWVISDLWKNPDDWVAAYNYALDAARSAAYDVAQNYACSAGRLDAWNATCVYDSLLVRQACRTLIAYDHAGALFDMPIEQVEVLAYLGQPAAVLLLPACRVREKRRELNHV